MDIKRVFPGIFVDQGKWLRLGRELFHSASGEEAASRDCERCGASYAGLDASFAWMLLPVQVEDEFMGAGGPTNQYYTVDFLVFFATRDEMRGRMARRSFLKLGAESSAGTNKIFSEVVAGCGLISRQLSFPRATVTSCWSRSTGPRCPMR